MTAACSRLTLSDGSGGHNVDPPTGDGDLELEAAAAAVSLSASVHSVYYLRPWPAVFVTLPNDNEYDSDLQ